MTKSYMTRLVLDSVETVRKEIETWGTPFVELDCYGTDNAERIAAMIDNFCRHHLDSGVRGCYFYRSSVGSTHGLQLEDGRDLVVKVHPPAHVNRHLPNDQQSLDTIFQVTSWLAEQGYPCPRPILGPLPLGNGLATVDQFLERGAYGNGFEPEDRKIIATGFAELIDRLRSFPGDPSCLKHFQRGDALYPQPHSKLFDFEKTAKGAEWIDDFARRGLQAEPHDGPLLLGHADWRVEHLRFENGTIVATYDWDSLAYWTETELVGISAHGFTADWSRENVRRIPTADDIRAYVSDYEVARGRPFSQGERQSLFAQCVYFIAYGARCTHSLEPGKKDWECNSWPYLLKSEGEALLRKP
jgi:hypothetical protein